MRYDEKTKRITLDPNDKLFLAYFLAGYYVRARQLRKRRCPVAREIHKRIKEEQLAAEGKLPRVARIENGYFERLHKGRIQDIGLPVSGTGKMALGVLRSIQNMQIQLHAENWRFTEESSFLLRTLLNKVLGETPETWVNECMEKLQDMMVQQSGAGLDRRRVKEDIIALAVLAFDLFIRKLGESGKMLATAYLVGFDLADGKLDRILGPPEPTSEPNTPPESYGDMFASIRIRFQNSLNVKLGFK